MSLRGHGALCPPGSPTATWGGLSEHREGHGDPREGWGPAGAACSLQYSREARGAPLPRGSRVVLEVPVREDSDTEPPAVPQPGANPHRPPVSPCPLIPRHSPAPLWLQRARQGHAPLGDPLGGQERRCRGCPTALPGLCPPGSRAWAQPVGSVTCADPGWAPWHSHGRRGQCPGVVGTLKPWRCDPGDTESSALGGLRGCPGLAPARPG